MTDIDNFDLRRIDMTMLMVFRETLRLRKLTLVGEKFGLTQSAISHILARLRDVFEDPLFLRRPHGLEPTARAIELEPCISSILEIAKQSLKLPKLFDPATASRRLRIAMLDHHAAIFGSALYRILEKEAPGIDLIVSSATRLKALDLMDQNEIDLMIGFVPDLPECILERKLYDENYAVVAKKSNTSFDGTLKSYLAAKHLLVSLSADTHGIVDDALRALGHRRKVAAIYPLFFPALVTVSETNLIVTLPKRLAQVNAARFKLQLFEPPVKIRTYPVKAIWHRRNEKDGGLNWIIKKLESVASLAGDKSNNAK